MKRHDPPRSTIRRSADENEKTTQAKPKLLKISFEFWAPTATSLSLMGTFNQWNANVDLMKEMPTVADKNAPWLV